MRGSSVVRGLLVGAAAAGLVYGANQVDVRADFARAGDRAASSGTSAAVNTTLVCPGPDRPGADEQSADGQGDSSQTVGVVSAVAPNALLGQQGSGALQFSRLPADGAGVGAAPAELTRAVENERSTLAGAAALRLTGTGSLAKGVSALQYVIDDESTVAGLAMSACAPATKDAWLPLGGKQSGRLGRIVLSNPGQAPVTVDAIVVGHDGPAVDKGASGVVVPPNDRVVISVGDFGEELADAMVHVSARGGSVGVTGFDAWMTGETPSGEAAAASAPAGTDLVMPAFPVLAGDPKVRIAVPGAQPATVRVRAMDADGRVVADEVGDVPAGSSGSIALQGLSEGWYALRVTSEQPVTAGAMASTSTERESDIAWSTPTSATEGIVGSALPPMPDGVRSTISLYSADKDSVVDVVTTGPDAGTKQVRVAADTETRVEVTGATGVWVRVRSGAVHTALASSRQTREKPLLEVAALQPVVVKSDLRESTADPD